MNRGQRRAAWLSQHRAAASARVDLGKHEEHLTSKRSFDARSKSASSALPSIRLHVEELRLHGFAARDRFAIGESLQGELTRMIAEQGIPPKIAQGGETARLDAGGFSIASGAKADAVGAGIARAVYGASPR